MKKYSVVICGGGSTYTPDMMELLCMMQKDFPLKRIVLFDNDEERQKPVGEFGKVMFKEYYPDLEYYYTLDPKEAFKDVDFAFVLFLRIVVLFYINFRKSSFFIRFY